MNRSLQHNSSAHNNSSIGVGVRSEKTSANNLKPQAQELLSPKNISEHHHSLSAAAAGWSYEGAPTENQYFEVASLINHAFKLDCYLTDMHSYFTYVSLFELTLYCFSVLFMLGKMSVNSIWYMIIALGHPFRALLGLYIAR